MTLEQFSGSDSQIGQGHASGKTHLLESSSRIWVHIIIIILCASYCKLTWPFGQVQPGWQTNEHTTGLLKWMSSQVWEQDDAHNVNICPSTGQVPPVKMIQYMLKNGI